MFHPEKPFITPSPNAESYLKTWTFPKGSGKKETRRYTITGEDGQEKQRSYESYVQEYVTMNLLVKNSSNGLWFKAGEACIDANSFNKYINAWASMEADNLYFACMIYGRMFGSSVRVYNGETGEFVGESEVFPQNGGIKVNKVKYTGWDNDYHCESVKTHRTFTVPGRFLYMTGKTTAFLSYDFVQREDEGERKRLANRARERRITQEIANHRHIEVTWADDTPIFDNSYEIVIGPDRYRYAHDTTDPYLCRWELYCAEDNAWYGEGVPTNELMDKLVGFEPKTYEEWCAISKARWEAANA